MSPLAAVRRARVKLVAAVLVTAVLWAAALASASIAAAVGIDLLVTLPFGARRPVVPVSAVAAVLAAAFVLWHGRNARSLSRTALYFEERLPELRFALATVVQPAVALTPARQRELEQIVMQVDRRGVVGRPVLRALLPPAVILAIGVAMLVSAPDSAVARIVHPVRVLTPTIAPADEPDGSIGSRLDGIIVSVQPPAYAKQAGSEYEAPASVEALVGSSITVRGAGASRASVDSLGATLTDAVGGSESRALGIAVEGDIWSFTLPMPERPAITRLVDRSWDRLLVLDPVEDAVPVVTLAAPRADTSLTNPSGTLPVRVQMADDIGLARAEIELMYTSGSGEQYVTERRILRSAQLGGNTSAELRAAIRLDTMNLHPGDVLHIRALAWDANDVTGPGRGESETRTIQIVDPREVVDPSITAAAAAAIDTSIISQRMLVMRAESLLVQRPRIEDAEYRDRSIDLGIRQGELRGRVESIVFDLENVEGVGFVGETPGSAALRAVASEMQSAETELRIVQVPMAIVYMRKALALLQELRDTNRYWLRGLLTTTPVDVGRVRLSGGDPALVQRRDPRAGADDARAALAERLERVISLVEQNPEAARDTLQVLFATSLADARDVAPLLEETVAALTGGDDPRARIVAAYRRLGHQTRSEGRLSPWFGLP